MYSHSSYRVWKAFFISTTYNWQVMKDHFLKAQLGEAGDLIDGAIKDWLASSTPEQRQVFVDGVFEVLNASNATTLRELGSGLFRSFPSFVKSYRSISEEDRKTIMQMDGQCAATTAVMEMMAHEVGGEVEFFRGCPEAWREVSFENLALSDGRRVSGFRANGHITVKYVK